MASPPSAETETEDTQQSSPISNPRRLLILSTAHHSSSIIPPLLHTLTGVAVTSLPTPPPPQPTAKDSDPTTTNDGDDTNDTTPIPPPSSSFAGYTSHSPLHLETKYYTADIPIWVDEVPYTHPSAPSSSTTPPPPHPSTWKTEFLTPEARVVRDAIGALIVCLPVTSTKEQRRREEAESLRDIVEAVGGVRDRMEEERGGVGDVPGVVVLVGKGDGDGEGEVVGWWEEELLDRGVFGWEVVAWDPKGEEGRGRRNQFGELEGLERVKEVLEANEWASTDDDDDGDGDLRGPDYARLGLLSDIDEGDEGFNLEVGELEREMLGLKMAIEKGGGDGEDDGGEEERDEELQVEELEGLMLKMQAVKERGAEMPEAERRKFAIKAVRDILKDV